jgi:hypothetical protein
LAAPQVDPDSTFELPPKASSVEIPIVKSTNKSRGDLPVMPLAEGDLRETFDLPMMTEAAPAAKGKPDASRQVSDATALFDDRPSTPRRKTGAEARAHSRRCPTCGGVVQAGMSICQTCGLDLDTGMRVGLEDDLSPPPAPRAEGLPLAMTIVGVIALAAAASLLVLSIVFWFQGVPGTHYFVPVAGFGIYAAVQFLRGKSVKLLLIALTLGAVIDLLALVALPIYNAQAETQVVQRQGPTENPDDEDVIIRPVADQLDTNRLTLGLTVLGLYAAVSIYLLSPHVQKQFRR